MSRDDPRGNETRHVPSARVRDLRGHGGRILGDLDDGVVVRLDDGRQVLLPGEALRREPDGSYSIAFDLDPGAGDPRVIGGRSGPAPAESSGAPPPRSASASDSGGARAQRADETAPRRAAPEVRDAGIIPVLSEELVVERRAHVTGGVRLHKSVHERTALVDEPVVRERVTVERVSVNRALTDPTCIPTVREEDGVLIVPVIEERLVVEKQLVLKEELHVRRIREESRDRQEVTLHREHVDVERFDANDEQSPPRGH